MRAVLRRSPDTTSDELLEHDAIGELGGIRLEPETRRAFVRDAEVHLRRKEFELLLLLMENAGRVLTRDVLMDRVWGSDYVGDTKTLDVHIKRLRAQIEVDPSTPLLITTIRGVGYRFDGT
jgi:two-component system response regulator RegX3